MYEYQGYNQGVADYDKELNAVCTRVVDKFYGKMRPIFGYMTSSEQISGYDTRHNTFIGAYDCDLAPRALKRGMMENNSCHSEKCCMAVENTVTLMPGEEKNIVFICGFNIDKTCIKKDIERYCSYEKAFGELSEVYKYFADTESNVRIETPDENLNKMWNNWLKHATLMGSQWARVRHNGIRDLTQDCQCFSVVNPEIAYEKLKRVMRYQYSNGYAARTVKNGSIIDNNFSDNCVWLAMAVRDIVAETGNKNILFEEVEFNDGTKANVYEHVKRSVEFLYNFRGMYNLIKIWGGDWNDCMNKAGLEGKGVSIWLSMAWCLANDSFSELAEILGNESDVKLSKKRGKEMREIINKYGWDGEYYLTTYTDDGIKIGTHEDNEGKIFLMPQIWSIMANVCDKERQKVVLSSIDKYLKTDIGTLISNPGFSECRDYLGSMSCKEQGAQENGGIYLQPICWKMIVDNITKNPNEMAFDIDTILPSKNKIVCGRGEPYILYNSYNSNPDNYRYGTPGQSWRTATSQWFVNVMVKYVYGLQPYYEGLKIVPCIPDDWERCTISKEFRGALYNFEYIGNGCDIERIQINQKDFIGEFLPCESGKRYNITVYMK